MESGAVFADPSGRRHRILRFAGLGVAVLLAVFLGAVAVAMTGGPQAPFTQWAAPQAPAGKPGGHAAQQGAGHPTATTGTGSVPGRAPGAAGGTGNTTPAKAAPSPSAGPSVSPAASPSVSLAPTNPAGRTPPGQTKSPNPRKSTSAAA